LEMETESVTTGMSNLKIKAPEFSWNRFKYSGNAPPPTRYASACLYDNHMYVFGGLAATKQALNTVSRLDLDKQEWTLCQASGKVPPGRLGHSADLVGDNWYIFGGSTDGRYDSFDDFYVYNFKTMEWTQIEKTPDAVWPESRYHHSSVVIGKTIYIFGGSFKQSKHYGDFYSFDTETRKWTKIEAEGTPAERSGHLSFVFDNKIYIFGGFYGDGGFERRVDMFTFDVTTSKWSSVEPQGSLPFTARALNGVVASNGNFYVYGGYDGKKPVRSLIEYRPKENIWITAKVWLDLDENSFATEEGEKRSGVGTTKGTEPTPRYGHVTVIRDEKITVFGGSGSTYLNDVFQFDLTLE
jgi:N-acetylneuraminic acid mutarotase